MIEFAFLQQDGEAISTQRKRLINANLFHTYCSEFSQ